MTEPDESTETGTEELPESVDDDTEELSETVADEAERLTRLARETASGAETEAYREARADLLADHGFTARVREDGRDTLVLYPSEWAVDDTVHPHRVEDVGRAVERPLDGPGEADEWEAVAEHNHTVAEAVAADHGEVHGANATALADFASNHYAKPVEDLTPGEREEFLTEYFPRNAFPSDDQNAVVEESVQLVLDAAGSRYGDLTGADR